MARSSRKKQALKALVYDLFEPETLNPPAPATMHHRIREATEHARPERVDVQPESASASRTELPAVDELYRLFDRFNWLYFGGKLPSVKIEYSGRMGAAGSYSPGRKLIKIGRKYHQLFPQDLEDTLKHEMIHIIYPNHDRNFKAEATRIGASLRAREHPSLRRPPKYVYECPGCGMDYPRQKRIVMASCGRCSRGGKFDPRFKLRRKKIKPSRSATTT